ncbi:MAG: AAA family ATPase [Ferruginibacter sp.]
MDKIRIRKFKAFREDISIILENSKNLLLYGENGAGKTSIFESLKIAFFKEKIESGLIAQTPEDLQQLKYQFWNSFNNKIDNQEFEIEINDVSYKIFDTSVYQFFLVSIDDLVVVNEINLNTLLSRFYFDFNISNICQNHYQFIQDNVNATLFSFGESVTIVIDEEDNYNIKLADTKKNIETKSELKKYFNEAKLNLIILLIILNAIIQSKETEKQKVIVLDDFITSLDASNRTFLTKYLLEKFSRYSSNNINP